MSTGVHRRSGRRTTTIITTVLALVLGLVGVFARTTPAVATHGLKAIQVFPDVVRVKAAQEANITIRMDPFTTAPPTDLVFNIHYEVVGGPAEIDRGYSPLTPDGVCQLFVAAGAPDAEPDCTMTLSGTGLGTSQVFFWVDEAPGVAEVDPDENRLANIGIDCNPAIDPSARNGNCQEGEADEGSKVEPDDTDVISVTWYPAPDLLNCFPVGFDAGYDTGAVRERNAGRVDCLARSAAGVGVEGAVVDGENFADSDDRLWTNDGANDPDHGTPPPEGSPEASRPETADYNDVCTTDASGHCSFQIPASRLHLGTAVICFWVDGIDGALPNGTNNSDVTDTTFQRPSTVQGVNEESDGGECNDEKVDETISGPGTLPDPEKITDLIMLSWEPPLFIKGGIDVQPEAQSLSPGTTTSVTAIAYDQFSAPLPNIEVWFEFFRGSVSFPENDNTPESPDAKCVTESDGACSISFRSTNPGRDVICAWTQREVGDDAMTRPPSGSTGSADVIGTVQNAQCGPQPPSNKPAEYEGPDDPTANDGIPSPAYDAFDVVTLVWNTPPQPPPPPPPPPPPTPTGVGYWLYAEDGGIFTFGPGAAFHGSTGNMTLNKPIVTAAATPSGKGYWLVASDGGVFAFGDAGFFGSTGSMRLNQPIVGMAPTPSGQGYWLVASDGGIFSFGDAAFYGSTGSMKLNKPIIGMARTPDGKGYWLYAGDGGIFTFGDIGYYGSTGDFPLAQPIVAMAATPSGQGYWLVASDGGIFTFGDASYFGSTVGQNLNRPIVGFAPTPTGDGYWLVASDGGMFTFGDAAYFGSTGGQPLNKPILGIAVSVQLA